MAELNSSGHVVGKLTCSSSNGEVIDCARRGVSGVAIPHFAIDPIEFIPTEASFILLVENDSAYCKLAEDRFYNHYPCIIIHSIGHKRGQPNVATMAFLQKLHTRLNLPVRALFNCDPAPFRLCWSYGCQISWLGLRPSDFGKYRIPQGSTDPMTEEDIGIANALLEEDFIKNNQGWVDELSLMVRTKQKAPVESLCALSLRYLTREYLPRKLREEDWL